MIIIDCRDSRYRIIWSTYNRKKWEKAQGLVAMIDSHGTLLYSQEELKGLPERITSTSHPPPTEGHPSDRLVDSYMVADNTVENEEGERVVDLGDGMYNLDKGEGFRNLSREETEFLSNIFPIRPQGTIQVKVEQDELYLQRNGERIDITGDEDFNFGYFFPEFESIAGGSTKPPNEEEGMGTLEKVIAGGLAVGATLAGVGWYVTGPGPQNQQQERIQSIKERGVSHQKAIQFDKNFEPDQSYRWPWEQNKPYRDDEVKLAEIYAENPEVVNKLIDGVQRDDPNWLDAVHRAITSDQDEDELNLYEEIVKYNTDFRNPDTSGDEIEDGQATKLGLDPVKKYPAEFVDYISPLDFSKQKKIVNASVEDGRLTKTGMYGIKRNLSPDTLPYLKDMKFNEESKTFIDKVSALNSNIQEKVARGVLKDGSLSTKELNQTRFLAGLSEKELNKIISDYSIMNKDLDEDNRRNFFEKVTGTDYLSPKNDYERYAILLGWTNFDPNPEGEYSVHEDMSDFLVKKEGFKPQNIFQFENVKKLEDVTENVAELADKDDLVYTHLIAHGGKYGMGGLSYSKMDNLFGRIDCRALVISIDSCYSGGAIDYLKDGSSPRVVMTQTTADQTGGNAELARYFIPGLADSDVDKNGYGFNSVREAFIGAKRAIAYDEKRRREEFGVAPENITKPQFSDSDNISDNIFFGDFIRQGEDNKIKGLYEWYDWKSGLVKENNLGWLEEPEENS